MKKLKKMTALEPKKAKIMRQTAELLTLACPTNQLFHGIILYGLESWAGGRTLPDPNCGDGNMTAGVLKRNPGKDHNPMEHHQQYAVLN